MTSSLVGSEMCIRDRHCTRAHRANEATALFNHKKIRQCALAFVAQSLQAVSYTHLTLPTICSV
eukprot:11902724-Prorocentrum_lima.AAC.1